MIAGIRRAGITSDQGFYEKDVNGDGVITLDEFLTPVRGKGKK